MASARKSCPAYDMNGPAGHPANRGGPIRQGRFVHRPGPLRNTSVSSTYPMVVTSAAMSTSSSDRPLEDDMPGHPLRTHSLQESRSGLIPSPAWDQAIVLSNRGPVSQ